MAFFLIFLGGGAGSVVRYSISLLLNKYSLLFPYSTLVVNILGSFLIAVLAYKNKPLFDNYHMIRLMFITGFLGGFTTFSTFSLDFFNLVTEKNYLLAFTYAFLSVTLSLLAFLAGLVIFR
ncbi:Putative fluoride ion transporter CrcB [Candidatus Hepatincola sp. Pdp]